jgi:hypothetical protein
MESTHKISQIFNLNNTQYSQITLQPIRHVYSEVLIFFKNIESLLWQLYHIDLYVQLSEFCQVTYKKFNEIYLYNLITSYEAFLEFTNPPKNSKQRTDTNLYEIYKDLYAIFDKLHANLDKISIYLRQIYENRNNQERKQMRNIISFSFKFFANKEKDDLSIFLKLLYLVGCVNIARTAKYFQNLSSNILQYQNVINNNINNHLNNYLQSIEAAQFSYNEWQYIDHYFYIYMRPISNTTKKIFVLKELNYNILYINLRIKTYQQNNLTKENQTQKNLQQSNDDFKTDLPKDHEQNLSMK